MADLGALHGLISGELTGAVCAGDTRRVEELSALLRDVEQRLGDRANPPTVATRQRIAGQLDYHRAQLRQRERELARLDRRLGLR